MGSELLPAIYGFPWAALLRDEIKVFENLARVDQDLFNFRGWIKHEEFLQLMNS